MKDIEILPPSPHRIVQSWQSFTSGTAPKSNGIGRSGGGLKKRTRIAIVDLGVWIGELNTLVERINAAQQEYELLFVRQVVPAWLTSQPHKVAQWLRGQLGRDLTRDEEASLKPHIILDDYRPLGLRIQKQYGIPFVFGLTPAMVTASAGKDEPKEFKDYVNCFSSSLSDVGLISTAEVVELSQKAKRPFVVGIGILLVGAILAETNAAMHFHGQDREDSGCIFDYCDDRSNLVLSIRNLHIEQECLALLRPARRAAALAMVSVLTSWEDGLG